MSKYVCTRLSGLEPYTPGEQPQDMAYIKLNTNESPFAPSPKVLDALSRESVAMLNLYPDPQAKRATEAVASYYGLGFDNVLLGNGSDELLYFCFLAYCDEANPPCFADITYGFYSVYARLNCLSANIVPLKDDFTQDIAGYVNSSGTCFIANPNAPTGLFTPLCDIERVLRSRPDNIVVVDEAYVDFCDENALKLINEYDNLIIIRTMSKSRNLAGARLGYALAQKHLIDDLKTIKYSINPYNVNRLSAQAAQAAMEDDSYFSDCVSSVKNTRSFTVSELDSRGFVTFDSSANFIFTKPKGMSGYDYYIALKNKGVLVRHFKSPRIEDFVRVTIGTKEQMQAFLRATDGMVSGI